MGSIERSVANGAVLGDGKREIWTGHARQTRQAPMTKHQVPNYSVGQTLLSVIGRGTPRPICLCIGKESTGRWVHRPVSDKSVRPTGDGIGSSLQERGRG